MRQATKKRRGKPVKRPRASAPKARRVVRRRRATNSFAIRSFVTKSAARHLSSLRRSPAIKRAKAAARQLHIGHARVAIATAGGLVIALALFAGTAGWFNTANAITTPNQRDTTIEAMIDAETAASREAAATARLPLAVTKPAAKPAVVKPAAFAPAVTPAPAAAPVAVTPSVSTKPAKVRPAPRQPTPHSSRSQRLHLALATQDSGETGLSGIGSSSLVSEARRYIGGNPTGRGSLWCGAFMDMVLKRTGHRGGGNLALGYLKYGSRVSTPQVGAIAVMGRRGGGHVGVVSGFDANGNPIVISGNHNHRVAEATYPRSRIIAYVVP